MAANSFIRILRIYLLKLKTFFTSKSVLSFLFFLLLSTIFWFVNVLGKERETTITIPIRYIGIPQNIAITNIPAENIVLSVSDEGQVLLNYSYQEQSPLIVDLRREYYEKGEIKITSEELNAKISRYLSSTTVVRSIYPDTIFIKYERLATRTLPIQIDGNFEPANQYVFREPIRVEPAEITVFAPKHILDTLTSVKTEYLELVNLKETTSASAKLMPIESVRFSSSEVKVSIFPEMFTEKSIQIPITVSNPPKQLTIRTFPAVVDVKFNVGMSHFNKENDIQVVLDYNEIDKSANKHKLKFITTASYISNVQIFPKEVEFVLEEK